MKNSLEDGGSKSSISKVVKCLVFCILAGLMITGINRVLKIKGQEYGVYNPYAEYGGFYEMEKDTVDVLFLGSSHCYCGFSPQEFYDRFQIRGYNLGSSRQSIWNSYYWLREALKTQTPQVVVMDVYYTRLSSGDEPSIQKALSYMKWSPNKAEAVQTAVKEFPELDFKSFLLPNIRFHDRWKELGREDFILSELQWCKALKGYSPLSGHYNKPDFKMIGESEDDFEAAAKAGIELQPDTDELAQLPDLSVEYMGRIADLCKEKGIELILVKTPTVRWKTTDHNAVAKLARDHGLDFYDLNTFRYFNELNYDYAYDNADEGHANVRGAEKLCDYIGNLLVSKYNVRSVSDEQWEKTAFWMEKIKKEYAIKEIDDAAEYLKEITQGDYTILIAARGGVSEEREDLRRAWEQAGLSGLSDDCYAAVVDGESSRKRENSGADTAELEGTLHNGQIRYAVQSRSGNGGKASIQIDGKEYAKDKEGINIVVYSNTANLVLDRVVISTEGEGGMER